MNDQTLIYVGCAKCNDECSSEYCAEFPKLFWRFYAYRFMSLYLE
jgi:hypothetical protein